MQNKLFFDILQFSLGITDKLESTPKATDWPVLLQMAEEQSVVGVIYQGIERLPKEQRPQDRQMLFTWYAASEMISQTNKTVSANVGALARQLKADGLDCCVLKGQGIALLYPNPLMRTPGDIDMWVMVGRKTDVDSVISYVKKRSAQAGCPIYHHMDYGDYQGTEVEIHYRPSFMHAPWHNRRLQRYFEEEGPVQMSHQKEIGGEMVGVPTNDFNRIYTLIHIARHLTQSGIGLRQLIDYYYILKQGISEEERKKDIELLNELGLNDVAGAVMYVMKQLFLMEDNLLIVAPDERRGRFLLREIMQGGNFGLFDKRVSHFGRTSVLGRNLERLRRDWRNMRLFPSESLWEPAFRIYHAVWRMKHK